jgi:cerevisin
MYKIALICLVVAAATALPISQMAPLLEEGDIIPGSYIVTFKKDVDVTVAKSFADSFSARKFWNIGGNFVGFAGEFSDAVVDHIRSHVEIVEVVERNAIARTNARQQNPPSWGLGASSSITATNPGYYDYPDHAGAGAVIYIIDTGIRITHNDFGGRAVWGARYGQGGFEDGNGHGTHCAGTAAGTAYGIAKSATLVAVGVLGPSGSGSWDDVISGVEYSADNCDSRGAQCVGSMSLGGSTNTAVNNACNAFVSDRRFLAVAAGNSNANAQNYSPAGAADVYTVMATDSAARKASYSNYGAVCSIWAPGSSITSAWSTSDSATNTISGTSMACPHVAGAGALAFISGRGVNGDRFALENYINAQGTMNAISGVPSGTVNRALHVDTAF